MGPFRTVLACTLAILTVAAAPAGTDPSPTDCDAYLYYDGTVSVRRARTLRPEELVLIGESTRNSARLAGAWKRRDAEAYAADLPDTFRLSLPNGKLAADSAVVRSRQFFSRALALPDSTVRRRFTSVTHREVWKRDGARWSLRGFTEENQVARWVDE